MAVATGQQLPPVCQVALESRLCNSVEDQAASQAAGHLLRTLSMGQPAASRDAVAPGPPQQQRPASSDALAHVTVSTVPLEQPQSAVPAVQQSSTGQPAPSGLPHARQPNALAAVHSAQDPRDVGLSNGAYQEPQQQQQQQQQQQAGGLLLSGADDNLAHAEPAFHQHTEPNQPEHVGGATQRQASSSMVSLSPSLKLDIPGLDDILSSDLLSESEVQATSQLQLQQPPSGSTQQAVNDWQSVTQQQPESDRQQEAAQSTGHPAGPDTAGRAADEHAASQPSPHPKSPRETTIARHLAWGNASSAQDMPSHTEPQSASRALLSPRQANCAAKSSVPGESVAAQQQADPSTSQAAGKAVPDGFPGHLPASGCAKVPGTDQADVMPGLAQVAADATTDPAADANALVKIADDTCAQQHIWTLANHNVCHERRAEANSSPAETLEHGPSAGQCSVRMQADKDEPAAFLVADTASEQPPIESSVQVAGKGQVQLTESVHMGDHQAQSMQQTAETSSQKVRD